jgi:hypothetical protein
MNSTQPEIAKYAKWSKRLWIGVFCSLAVLLFSWYVLSDSCFSFGGGQPHCSGRMPENLSMFAFFYALGAGMPITIFLWIGALYTGFKKRKRSKSP